MHLFGAPYFKNRTAEAKRSIRQNAKFYDKLGKNPSEMDKYLKKVDSYFADLEKEFLQGGGKIEDFIKYKELWNESFKRKQRESAEMLAMLDNGTYYNSGGPMFLYITIGTKK